MLDLNALPHSVHTIKNRHGLDLFARLNGDPASNRPVALVAHGLSDVHDSGHMRAVTSALIERGYNVLTWDATHSWGRSGGAIDKATLTRMSEDMEDIIAWAEAQPWFRRPFVLAGHSMGGAAALRYAASHPDHLERLILTAPVVAGRLLANRLNPIIRTLWWLLGRLPEPGHRGHKWYSYELLHDGLRYDGRQLAPRVTVPTLIIAGDQDPLMLPADTEQLYQALPEYLRRLAVIPGADHTFSKHLTRLEDVVRTAML